MGNSSMLKWAAVFGVSIGLLTGIPFGGLLVCCSLRMIIVLPGFLAAWRVSVDAASRGEAFDVGPGTLTGLLAGLAPVPGGIGVAEATMSGLLTATGLPPELSVSVAMPKLK